MHRLTYKPSTERSTLDDTIGRRNPVRPYHRQNGLDTDRWSLPRVGSEQASRARYNDMVKIMLLRVYVRYADGTGISG